jgi:hypothetical protein
MSQIQIQPTPNINTFIIDGNTFPIKDLLKEHFQAKWNPKTKQWTIHSTHSKLEIQQILSQLVINSININ